MMSPAAAAPMPRSAPATSGLAANSTYRTASAITITSGSVIMPSNAANAPRHPKKRSPIIMATLQMFGPGNTCPTVRNSRNCALVSQRFFSHSSRWATASTPPKPCSASQVKPQNSSAGDAGRASATGSVTT